MVQGRAAQVLTRAAADLSFSPGPFSPSLGPGSSPIQRTATTVATPSPLIPATRAPGVSSSSRTPIQSSLPTTDHNLPEPAEGAMTVDARTDYFAYNNHR